MSPLLRNVARFDLVSAEFLVPQSPNLLCSSNGARLFLRSQATTIASCRRFLTSSGKREPRRQPLRQRVLGLRPSAHRCGTFEAGPWAPIQVLSWLGARKGSQMTPPEHIRGARRKRPGIRTSPVGGGRFCGRRMTPIFWSFRGPWRQKTLSWYAARREVRVWQTAYVRRQTSLASQMQEVENQIVILTRNLEREEECRTCQATWVLA